MKRLKPILTALLISLSIFSLCSTAYASTVEVVRISTEEADWLSENISSVNDKNGEVTGTEAWIKKYVTTDSDKAAKDKDGGPQLLGTWSWGTQAGTFYLKKGKTLDQLQGQIQTSMSMNNNSDRLFDMTEKLGIAPDSDAATITLQGFVPILNLVIGLIIDLITIGMTLFSASDIMYIAFPVYRNKCEEMLMNGGVGTKTTPDGKTRLSWVSDDAQYAVQEGTLENGKNPWTIYLRKRIISYVMLAIILFILMTGNISLITSIALNMVSGIMDVLRGLA